MGMAQPFAGTRRVVAHARTVANALMSSMLSPASVDKVSLAICARPRLSTLRLGAATLAAVEVEEAEEAEEAGEG